VIKSLISKFFAISVWLLPLALLVVPLPVQSQFDNRTVRWLIMVCIELILILTAFYRRLLNRSPRSFPGPKTFYLLLVLSLGLSFGCLIFCALTNWSLYSSRQSQIGAQGIITLLLTLATFSSSELLLRQIPAAIYQPEVATTPPLTRFVDKGNAIFQKNGFRGLRTCKDCPSNQIRIFTMGGSSVYGIPMYYSLSTYASVLQRILNERRPGENYEVLNAGIPGYGIVQVLDSIKQEVLKYKPDIITFGEWFNETAPSPGWYGIAGKSDMQGYMTVKLLLWLQNFRPYALIHRSKLFAIARFYLLDAREEVFSRISTAKLLARPRMTPDEYRTALHQFVKLADNNNFLPVFVLEPLNRTENLENSIRRNDYQRAMFEVARELDVPLVDPLTPLSKMHGAWLFYDIIHSNDVTHRTIAEAIYDTLFVAKNPASRLVKFAASRSIDLKQPPAKRISFHQFSRDEIRNKSIEIIARAPYLKNDSAVLKITANEKEIGSFTGLTDKPSSFKIKFDNLNSERPIVDVKMFAALSEQDEQNWLRLGQTDRVSPVYISAQSDAGTGGVKTSIFVREQRYDPKSRGYNVVIIGPKSGEVKSAGGFDIFGKASNAESFVSYMQSLDRFSEDGLSPLVALAVSHDGGENIRGEAVSSILRSVGGSGVIPKPYEAFVLIGALGAKPGSAVEFRGQSLAKTEIGSKDMLPLDLIDVQSVKVVD
jgi:hypothetical protein